MRLSLVIFVLFVCGLSYGEIFRSASSYDLPEGNYNVTIRFGNDKEATNNWVKAEGRRLVLDKVTTKPGEFIEKTFTVNFRTPQIKNGGKVSLKKGEDTHPRWSKQLELEIFSDQPVTAQPEVKPAPDAVTIYLAGDSTVTDQRNEPWGSWGMILPAFFQQGVAVSNHAESGLALDSFRRQKRLDKILGDMKKGDYLFIQFGHNDQKQKGENDGPFKSYKNRLGEYVDATVKQGGIPVLVTPMERRRFNKGKQSMTLESYAEAVKQVGQEKNVIVIDLHAMSYQLYGALGSNDSKKAFVHYAAGTFPNQEKALRDDTHPNIYGGYELARCIVEGIRANIPELAKHIRPEVTAFDPAKPDQEVDVPLSLASSIEKPDGD